MSVDNIWDNSDADNDGNVAANWSQNRVPINGDVMVFDSATTSANCTFSGNIVAGTDGGMRFDNTYTGTVDAVTFDITLGTSGLDGTLGGSATVLCGTGSTWTVAGNLDNQDIGTWTRETSTFILTGTLTIFTSNAKPFWNMTMQNTASITIDITTGNRLQIGGTLTVDCPLVLNDNILIESNGNMVIQDDAAITENFGKAITFNISASGKGLISFDSGGSISCPISITRSASGAVFVAGTYGGKVNIGANQFNGMLAFSAGNYVFDGGLEVEQTNTGTTTLDTSAATSITTTDFTYDINNASGTVTILNSAAGVGDGDCNWIFTGNVIDENDFGGTFTWTKGTGTDTFSGGAPQDVDFDGELLEAVVVNKSADVMILSGAFSPTSFTGTNTGTGDFDPNGQTITTGNCSWAAAFTFDGIGVDVMNGSDWQIGGNFTADGQDLAATVGWDLDVTGTAVASGAGDVDDCTAGGTEITATGWNDGGGNTNWDFGAPAAGVIMKQIQGSNVGADLFNGSLI